MHSNLLFSLQRPGLLKCDCTRTETRLLLSAKRTSPFKSAGTSVQSTTGSRGVRSSGSNAGCTMFRGSVKSTGYPLHSPVSPLTSHPVRHRVPSHFNWTLFSWHITYLIVPFMSLAMCMWTRKNSILRLDRSFPELRCGNCFWQTLTRSVLPFCS